METENKRKIIMIVCLVLVAIVLAGNIYNLIDIAISNEIPTIKSARIVEISFAIIALVSALLYISAGFKKISAKYFDFFLYAFILSLLITLFSKVIIFKESIFFILGLFIPFIILNILFGTKDLGKKTSLILSIVVLVCSLFMLLYKVFTVQNFPIRTLFLSLTGISLSAVLLVMMLLKYYDKSLRNTK